MSDEEMADVEGGITSWSGASWGIAIVDQCGRWY